jgi:hypothetical protein
VVEAPTGRTWAAPRRKKVDMKYYIVLYEGDVACGSSDSWQIWKGDQLADALDDRRILEYHPIVNWAQYISEK